MMNQMKSNQMSMKEKEYIAGYQLKEEKEE